MPLPDADPPEKSRLYEELKSKNALPGTSGSITPDLLDSLQLATFVDFDNEDQLRRFVLIKEATGAGSTSGPITGTMDVFELEATVSGASVSGFGLGLDDVPPGEMWQIYGFSIVPSGVSGSVSYELRIVGVGGRLAEISTGSSTLNSSFPLQEDIGPIYIGHGSKIQFEATGTFTTAKFRYCAVRVR